MTNHLTDAVYISTGDNNGFYTIRVKKFFRVPNTNTFFWRDRFLKNSSRTWKAAMAEALTVAKSRNGRLLTRVEDKWELNDWGSGKTATRRISHYYTWMLLLEAGVMPFGKHKDEKLSDLPCGYRTWLRTQNDGSAMWKLMINALEPYEAEDKKAAERVAEERAIKQAKIEEIKRQSRWIGYPGKRIATKVTCEHKHQFESRYGSGTISTLRDENGNCIKTFGVCRLAVGDTADVVFTIKEHSEWRDEKQTIVTRVQVK